MKRGFIPKGVDLNNMIEKALCSNCVLGSCSGFCEDALDIKRRIINDHLYSIFLNVLMSFKDELMQTKEQK